MVTRDAWLVDLDGTLYRARPLKAAMAVELALRGRRAIPVIREFRRQHEETRSAPLDRERSKHSGAEASTASSTVGSTRSGSARSSPYDRQIEQTARQLGLPSEDVRAVVERWMIVRPCAYLTRFRRAALLAEIGKFREAGGRTALVSDYPARAKLAAVGAADLFDAVIANGEPGGPRHLKPDPEGYLLAADRLGVPPERCLVIGDRDDADGVAARSAGMAFRLIR